MTFFSQAFILYHLSKKESMITLANMCDFGIKQDKTDMAPKCFSKEITTIKIAFKKFYKTENPT